MHLHTLVVTGTRLGALTVNEAMLALAGTITLNGWQILHLAGRDHGEHVRGGYREKNITVRVIDFTPAWPILGGGRPRDQPIRRQQLRRTDRLWRSLDPDAVSVPQRPSSAQNAKVLADAGPRC